MPCLPYPFYSSHNGGVVLRLHVFQIDMEIAWGLAATKKSSELIHGP